MGINFEMLRGEEGKEGKEGIITFLEEICEKCDVFCGGPGAAADAVLQQPTPHY